MQRYHRAQSRAQSNSKSRLRPTAQLAVVSTAAILASAALWACDRNGPADVPPYTEPATEEGEANRGLPAGAASQKRSMAEIDSPDDDIDEDIDDDIDDPDDGIDTEVDVDSPQWRTATAACPLLVDNVQVEIEEVPTGVALNFRTTEGDVEELQDRVEQMARMYELHDSSGGTILWHHYSHMRGDMDQQGLKKAKKQGEKQGEKQAKKQAKKQGNQGNQDEPMGVIPTSTAMVEDLDDGARLVLIPQDPDDIDELREQIRTHQQHMSAGECWMSTHGKAGTAQLDR